MGGGTSTTTSTQLPPELRELYENTADNMIDYQDQNPLTGFAGENPLQVAGPNAYQTGAAEKVGYLWERPPGMDRAGAMNDSLWKRNNSIYGGAEVMQNQAERMRTSGAPGAGKIGSGMEYAQDLARRRPRITSDQIADNAALVASQDAFARTAMPQIGNSMASMGLGRSVDKGRLIGDTWMKQATPHIQDAVQREVDRGNKMTDTQMGLNQQRLALSELQNKRQFQAMDAKNTALGTQQGAMQYGANLAGQKADWAGQNWDRQKGAIDTAMQVGGAFSDMENEGYKAAYDDFLRRQGLSEKATYAPFGQTGNMAGSKTSSSGK